MNNNTSGKSDTVVVYTSYITLKNGRRIYAHQYGKKAFRIVVKKTR